jgi:hypothetical protein
MVPQTSRTCMLDLDTAMHEHDNRRMKRTTLVLEDACIESVREIAHREGRQLSEVVNELLAEGLQRRRETGQAQAFALPAFEMGRPWVDLADRDALESALDS